MRNLLVSLVLVALASGLAGCGDSTLTVRNRSSFALFGFYLSSVGDDSWGRDQLGSEVLMPGETLILSNITCDDYDIRVIDEEGDECIIADVELCFSDTEWTLTDADLAACALFGP